MMNKKYILYLKTDKGWIEEKAYTNKEDAEYYLKEWQDEFPNCKFKLKAIQTWKLYLG